MLKRWSTLTYTCSLLWTCFWVYNVSGQSLALIIHKTWSMIIRSGLRTSSGFWYMYWFRSVIDSGIKFTLELSIHTCQNLSYYNQSIGCVRSWRIDFDDLAMPDWSLWVFFCPYQVSQVGPHLILRAHGHLWLESVILSWIILSNSLAAQRYAKTCNLLTGDYSTGQDCNM